MRKMIPGGSALLVVFLIVLSLSSLAFAASKNLDKDTALYPPKWQSPMVFKAGTTVTLNQTGQVTTGTLARDSSLYNKAGAPKVYAAGTQVSFDELGRVP